MSKLVAVVICVAVALPGGAGAASGRTLLAAASRAADLSVRRAVPLAVQSPARFDAAAAARLDAAYPRALQQRDDVLYAHLGLLPAHASARPTLLRAARALHARYDPRAHIVRVRRSAARGELVREYVRALVDQHYNLNRISGLWARDRDAALAADGTVDGFASFVSRTRVATASGRTPLDRFLATERAARSAGRDLAAQLTEIGGPAVARSALRTFPRTTEQLLHADKFLERERALPVSLPSTISTLTYVAAETFGELDTRALLRAFAVRGADAAAAGWGGGKIALYRTAAGETTAAIVLEWDSTDDAGEWRAAANAYVAAAFPGAVRHTCPEADGCWREDQEELALASDGTTTAFASGYQAELVAATLARYHPTPHLDVKLRVMAVLGSDSRIAT